MTALPKTESIPYYIGVKRIQAKPMTIGEYNAEFRSPATHCVDPDKEGYLVVYDDGYKSWSPKKTFEAAYFKLSDPDGNAIAPWDIEAMVASHELIASTDRTTVCLGKALTGFESVTSSSCVAPENYSADMGQSICKRRFHDKLWECMGFVLRWANYGLASCPKTAPAPKNEAELN